MLFASTIHQTYHTVDTPHWVTIHDILSEYSKTRPSFPDTSSSGRHNGSQHNVREEVIRYRPRYIVYHRQDAMTLWSV